MMRPDTAFRLSFFLTLGMACACLVQAEAFFMPWFPYVVLPLAVLVFALAWRFEGRWVINDTGSNYLGIFIGLASGGWILLQVPRSDADLAAGGVSWPAGLLPHVGLLLLMLLVVKLFRPKQPADFWVIQTIGLTIVTLGCVLAGDALFAGLLCVYLASLVWCLALFQRDRDRRATRTSPLFAASGAAGGTGTPPLVRLGIGNALRGTGAVLAFALALFVVTPRNNESRWEPQKLSSSAAVVLSVGIEQGMDLNRTGTIELSPEPAFHVTVAGSDGRAIRLSAEPLWRVEVLDFYQRGHWSSWSQAQDLLRMRSLTSVGGSIDAPSKPGVPVMGGPPKLPQPIGPLNVSPSGLMPPGLTLAAAVRPTLPQPHADQRHLHFNVQPAKAGGLPLAEPLDTRHVGIDPLVGAGPPKLDLFYAVPGGDSVIGFVPIRRWRHSYSQIVDVRNGADRIPARTFDPSYRDYLMAQPVPGLVAEWAWQRLEELPSLTPQQREQNEDGHLPEIHHAVVSQALCRYLARSGDYVYSLSLRQVDSKIDPTADFLLNVKSGHCERFAAALALGLRGLGVPTRVVKGFRGADEQDDGAYVVRMDQAHSWVQVLLRDADGWTWVTLDPTPGQGGEKNGLATWLSWLSDLDAGELWRRFVLNYNGDVQANSLHYLGQGLLQWSTSRPLLWMAPSAFAVALALVVIWRRGVPTKWFHRRRRHQATVGQPRYYRRLLQVLARRLDLRPQHGQTPLEFASHAGDLLAQHPEADAWAALPTQVVQALYRTRFGAQGLCAAEQAAILQQIDTFERRLRLIGRGSVGR
jgi:hypothetical protein